MIATMARPCKCFAKFGPETASHRWYRRLPPRHRTVTGDARTMRRTLHGKPSPRRFHPRNSSNPDARVPASAQRHCGKTRESGCMNFPDRRTDRDAEKKKPLPQTRKRQCAICITVVIQPATTSHRCRLTGRSEICQKKRERLSGSAQVRRKGCISIPKTRF